MGFTHVELMPITEHPFYGSWGYQTTGYFAPTARYGTPQDFMYFVDHLHQRGIGVLLDWVPSHFPDRRARPAVLRRHASVRARRPAPGLSPRLELEHLQLRPQRGAQLPAVVGAVLARHLSPRWAACRCGSVDALPRLRAPARRVDPEPRGGKENLEAIGFLHELNRAVYRAHPDVMTVAEESTAWPMVSRPIEMGGSASA
jgi:1,4-alpha-glucan branching enzyme